MAVFKFIVNSKSKSYKIEKDQGEAPLSGKKIGDTFSGDVIGLNGFELQITGGSDNSGFPMRSDIEGTVKKRFLITRGKGFSGIKKIRKKKVIIDGYKKRKMLRGNIINSDITQINCKVVKEGEKNLEDLFGKKEEPNQEEKKE